MRGLKILVVFLGIMLIVGFTVLVAVVASRMSGSGSSSITARAVNGSAIDIARGARIEAMAAGTDRLVLALVLPEGGRQLLIIDLTTGARLGTIELHTLP